MSAARMLVMSSAGRLRMPTSSGVSSRPRDSDSELWLRSWIRTWAVEEVLLADRARARHRARRASSQEYHSRIGHDLRWLIMNANFITCLFRAEKLGDRGG